MAITWRNVDAPDFRAGLLGINQAGASIKDAFSGLGEAITGFNQQRVKEVKDQDALVMSNYLDTLQKAGNVEEIERLRQSGALDAMRGQLQLTGSRDALRGALDARVAGVQTSTIANDTYLEKRLKTQSVPVQEQIQTLLANGDFAAARETLAANPWVYDSGGLAEKMSPTAEALFRDNAEKTTHARNLATIQNPTALTNARTDAQKADTAAAQAVNTEVTRAATDFIAGAFDKHRQDLDAARTTVQTELDSAGEWFQWPRDKNGKLEFSKFTPEQRAQADRALGAKKLGTLESHIRGRGDTEAVADIAEQARKQFPNNPAAVQIAIDNYKSTIGHGTGNAPLVGGDAQMQAVAQQQLQNETEEFERVHGFMASGADAKELTSTVDQALEAAGIEKGSSRHEYYSEYLNRYLGTGGIKAPQDPNDPKPATRLLPSVGKLASLIKGTEKSWYNIAGFKEDEIKETMEAWEKDPENLKAARLMIDMRNRGDLLGVLRAARSTKEDEPPKKQKK